MPIYEYRCDQGHTFEVMHRISDVPVEVCNTCEAPVHRVFHPVAVHQRQPTDVALRQGEAGRTTEAPHADDDGATECHDNCCLTRGRGGAASTRGRPGGVHSPAAMRAFAFCLVLATACQKPSAPVPPAVPAPPKLLLAPVPATPGT